MMLILIDLRLVRTGCE